MADAFVNGACRLTNRLARWIMSVFCLALPNCASASGDNVPISAIHFWDSYFSVALFDGRSVLERYHTLYGYDVDVSEWSDAGPRTVLDGMTQYTSLPAEPKCSEFATRTREAWEDSVRAPKFETVLQELPEWHKWKGEVEDARTHARVSKFSPFNLLANGNPWKQFDLHTAILGSQVSLDQVLQDGQFAEDKLRYLFELIPAYESVFDRYYRGKNVTVLMAVSCDKFSIFHIRINQ